MNKFIAALAAGAFLAGCGGSQGQMSPAIAPATSAGAKVGLPDAQSGIGPDFCRHSGIVRVSPCKVAFTPSNSGPVELTVSLELRARGTVVDHNDCGGATGVAKVIRRSNFKWRVVAGASAGTCVARLRFFHNGDKDGWAEVDIKNTL
ncbi:MAG TPA: hypothetical protein VHS56_13405 [Candidatus Cybelea sp.]|nr:hypothetical protein [Candidatus Cybelea sp.]